LEEVPAVTAMRLDEIHLIFFRRVCWTPALVLQGLCFNVPFLFRPRSSLITWVRSTSLSKWTIWNRVNEDLNGCSRVNLLFHSVFRLFRIDKSELLKAALWRRTGMRTWPNVFVNGRHIGGNEATKAAYREGKLIQWLQG